MQSVFKHTAEEIRRQVEDLLSGVGLLCRVFARGKDMESLRRKIEKDPNKYKLGGKLIQDTIGVRVALYFADDIEVVKDILSKKYVIDVGSSTIDKPDSDQFAVTRYNLVFKLPEDLKDVFLKISNSKPLDATFEVQIRSILSEGWHEVEHDLRYKAKENWLGQDDLSRALNGVVATLETSEWSMSRIFDELAYRHYKSGNWVAMLHSKLRMRVKPMISIGILEILNADPRVAKEMLRIDRSKVLRRLSTFKPRLPINMDNIIFLWNAMSPRCAAILSITPLLIMESMMLKED